MYCSLGTTVPGRHTKRGTHLLQDRVEVKAQASRNASDELPQQQSAVDIRRRRSLSCKVPAVKPRSRRVRGESSDCGADTKINAAEHKNKRPISCTENGVGVCWLGGFDSVSMSASNNLLKLPVQQRETIVLWRV